MKLFRVVLRRSYIDPSSSLWAGGNSYRAFAVIAESEEDAIAKVAIGSKPGDKWTAIERGEFFEYQTGTWGRGT